MLDQKTIEVARQLIHPQLAERQDLFAVEIPSFIAQRSQGDWKHPAGVIHGLVRLASDQIKIRIALVTKSLIRVVSEGRLQHSATLVIDMMQEIEIHAREAEISVGKEVLPVIESLEPNSGVSAILEDSKRRALELSKGEVSLFVHRLSAAKSAPNAPSGTTVNIGGNVGAMMTGDYATANVVQHFGADEKQVVELAIAAVREYLADQGRDIPELTEIVDDAEVEANKGKPNLAKLRGLLSGAAGLIQTAAAAKPAYDAVKAALSVFGIGGTDPPV